MDSQTQALSKRTGHSVPRSKGPGLAPPAGRNRPKNTDAAQAAMEHTDCSTQSESAPCTHNPCRRQLPGRSASGPQGSPEKAAQVGCERRGWNPSL